MSTVGDEERYIEEHEGFRVQFRYSGGRDVRSDCVVPVSGADGNMLLRTIRRSYQ